MINKKLRHQFFRSRKRLIRNGLISMNLVLFIGVALFVITSRPSSAKPTSALFSSEQRQQAVDPLDTLSSADIAVNIAQLTNMDEATAVSNNADSINSQLDVVPVDAQIVAKPQIVTTDIKSAKDIQSYVAVAGDTVSSIAKKYGITNNTVKWSNNLTGNYLTAGTTLTIPPLNGLVYTVKAGDTFDSLASRYSTSKDQIISYNDAEITGLVVGKSILIPNGTKPIVPVYNFRAADSGFNSYDFGNCTYYVANNIKVPTNWGNAKTWDDRAAQTPGWGVIYSPGVNEVPVGAILVSNTGYYGHVAIVEKVLPDGSIYVTEMNYIGFNVISDRTISPGAISNYNYIIKY